MMFVTGICITAPKFKIKIKEVTSHT